MSSATDMQGTYDEPGQADVLHSITLADPEVADMLRARFAANLRAFAKHNPEVAAAFSDYVPVAPFELIPCDDGSFNLRRVSSESCFYPADSPLDYSRELVDRQLDTTRPDLTVFGKSDYDRFGYISLRYTNECFKLTSCDADPPTLSESGYLPACLLAGIGLGYGVQSLYERLEVDRLLVIEPDPDLLYASLLVFDWAQLLDFLEQQHRRAEFVWGSVPEKVYRRLDAFFSRQGNFLAPFCPWVFSYMTGALQRLVDALIKDFHFQYSGLGFYDDVAAGLSQGIYAFEHGCGFIRRNAELPPEYANLPLFIIGSGPSLDADLPFLRRAASKAVFLACGTALEALHSAGIRPDFYCAIERVPLIGQVLRRLGDSTYVSQITLLCGDSVHPDTLRMFRRSMALCKANEAFYWYMTAMRLAPALKTGAPLGPMVCNCGLVCAAALGFKNIYLFGVDNGSRTGEGGVHSEHVQTYQDLEYNENNQLTYSLDSQLPGNFGGMCESGPYFRRSLRNLERTLRDNPQIRCRNCSDGCLIDGALPLHSVDIPLDTWAEVDKRGLCDTTDTLCCFAGFVLGQQMPKPDTSGFSDLCRQIKEALPNAPAGRLNVTAGLFRVQDLLEQTGRTPQRYMTQLLFGTTQYFFMYVQKALYHARNERICVDLALRVLILYRHFLDDACEVFAALPAYTVGEHRKVFGGTVGRSYPDSQAPLLPDESEAYLSFTR